MKAILSDIHGNLEAFRAVLEDIARHGVKDIYCLGDVVGYGPNPRECVDLAIRCKVALLGNHDQGTLFDPPGFNPLAERAILWTRAQLEASVPNTRAMGLRWEFLGEMPLTHREDGFLFVHGSPRKPISEYIFPADAHNRDKMTALFALVERGCFQGHTHIPGVFTPLPDGGYRFQRPPECGDVFRFDSLKALCNVGSVGQPRDGDPRACYVLFDGKTIVYRRVTYDVEATVAKIHAVPDLDNTLGDRLRRGR